MAQEAEPTFRETAVCHRLLRSRRDDWVTKGSGLSIMARECYTAPNQFPEVGYMTATQYP